MGIKNKLLILISLENIIIFIILAYFIMPVVEQAIFERTSKTMVLQTEEEASKLDNWFSERGQVLKAIAVQVELNRLDNDEESLAALMEANSARFKEQFDYIYIGFENKNYYTTRPIKPDATTYDPTGRTWYKSAIGQSRLVVSEPYTDIITKKFTVSMAFPVETATRGVIATDLDYNEAMILTQNVLFHPQAKGLLLSKSGMIIGSTDEALGAPGENVNSIGKMCYQQILAKIVSERQGSAQCLIGNVPYRVSFSSIASAGWVIAIFLPESVFKEEVNKILSYMLSLLVLGIVVVFGATYYVIGQVTKPLEQIAVTALELGTGDLSKGFDVFGSREVKNLGHSLNTMKSKLVQTIEDKDSLLEETIAQNSEIFALYQQMKALNDELEKAYQDKDNMYVETIKALADSIEAKDEYTKGHSDRVLYYAEKAAQELGWNDEQKRLLRFAAILHDIGKIAVPKDIINKPGSLDNGEYEIIKAHPRVGYKILANIHYLDEVSRAVLQHHERVDGLGYPDGLRDGEILPMAKVLAVADAFDAMTSERPYRKTLTFEQAFHELYRCTGRQFDPLVVRAFSKAMRSTYDREGEMAL